MILGKFIQVRQDVLYFIARVLVGFMFFMHGTGKLFGWFGGNTVPLGGMFGVAGVVESLVGLAIVLGVFSRLAAVGGIITMLVAYFVVHLPNGFNPLQNGGELAILYFVSFLILLINGNGRWSLEQAALKREIF